jgi:integrase
MHPSLAKMLAEHRLASHFSSDTDPVFASSAGTPLAVRNIIRRGLEPAIEAAGLPRLRWHDLRHVAASLLIAQGASVGYFRASSGRRTRRSRSRSTRTFSPGPSTTSGRATDRGGLRAPSIVSSGRSAPYETE